LITEKEILVGFACGHVFHLSHVQEPQHAHDNESEDEDEDETSTTSGEAEPEQQAQEDYSSYYTMSRSVGPKVTAARLIRDRVGDGCQICALGREVEKASAGEI
jgi:hypothetical protein